MLGVYPNADKVNTETERNETNVMLKFMTYFRIRVKRHETLRTNIHSDTERHRDTEKTERKES
jgi:hypothetical protein